MAGEDTGCEAILESVGGSLSDGELYGPPLLYWEPTGSLDFPCICWQPPSEHGSLSNAQYGSLITSSIPTGQNIYLV